MESKHAYYNYIPTYNFYYLLDITKIIRSRVGHISDFLSFADTSPKMKNNSMFWEAKNSNFY